MPSKANVGSVLRTRRGEKRMAFVVPSTWAGGICMTGTGWIDRQTERETVKRLAKTGKWQGARRQSTGDGHKKDSPSASEGEKANDGRRIARELRDQNLRPGSDFLIGTH